MQHVISKDGTSGVPTSKLTRALLACGVITGPLYIIVGGIEMLTAPDSTRPVTISA